jgi:hypothetical protein
MTTPRGDGKAKAVLILLVVLGMGLLAIPFFLTPPAFLEVALKDVDFSSDLTGKAVQITEDATGNTLSGTVENLGGHYLARIGRIDSGEERSFTVKVEGYRDATFDVVAPPVSTVRAAVDLVPTFGRLELTVVSATQADRQVPALLKRDGTAVSPLAQSVYTLELPPGKYKFAATAAQHCPGERELQVEERKLTKVLYPVTPDLTGNEVVRFILDWGENPRDLDAHFGPLSGRGDAYVYYAHKQGRNAAGDLLASLDVDYQRSQSYETITVYDKAAGEYQYLVDYYAGEGTFSGSGAQVEVFTRGCQRRKYSVPLDCNENPRDYIWQVTNLRVEQGRVEFVDQMRCKKVGARSEAKPAGE